MTAIQLARQLIWDILTRRVRPGDVVVREFDFDHTYVEIHYLDSIVRPEHPDQYPGPGIHHAMFSQAGTLPERRLLKLD